jgi:hypothetical protein
MRTLLWIGLLGLLLTACQVRVEERIEVSEDGSGSVSLATMFDEEAEGMVTLGFGMEGVEGSLGADAPPGFAVESVSDGDLEGFAVRADFAELSEASNIADQLSDEGGLGEITLERADDSIVFRLNLPQEGLGASAGDLEAIEEFGDLGEFTGGLEEFIQITVTAVLPGEIVYTNADSVSGGTAEWVIDPFGTRRQLYATSQPASGFGSFWMWLVVGFGLVLMVVGLLGLNQRQRSERPALEVDPPAEGELTEAGTSRP